MIVNTRGEDDNAWPGRQGYGFDEHMLQISELVPPL
jgi:hypothetical protein